MQIPPDDLDKLFEKHFIRGAVLATEMHFHSGVSKRKYLIVLNHNPSDSETLLFLTTSQVDFFKKHPSFKDHLMISPGAVSFFTLETVINCHGVQCMGRPELKRRYREKKLNIVGDLPHKRAILGWK